MSDSPEIIDIERESSKHLSFRQLCEQHEGDCDDNTAITANIKRELDQKYDLVCMYDA